MSDRRLQRAHAPLTRAYPRLTTPEEARAYELDDEQLRSFEREGYVERVRVLDAEQVGALRERLEHLRTHLGEHEGQLYEVEAAWRERPAAVVFHFLGAWMVDELFHDLLFHPALTVPMAQLLGVERLRFWHDQVFYKPPHHPGVVPWHQDYSYWDRTAPACHITANLVLDDTSLANGCLHVVPGSHRWPLLAPVPFDAEQDQLLRTLPPALAQEFEPRPLQLRAGEASFHHSHTLHGSGPNASAQARRAVVVNAMGDHVRVADGSRPLLAGVPLLPTGALVEGEHFPIVHPPEAWSQAACD